MGAGEDIVLGGRVVTPHGIREGWLRVHGSTIAEISDGAPPTHAATGEWIVPGFVDIHCHGGGGGSFTSADPTESRTAVAAHRAHGTTTMLASLVSAPIDDLAEQIEALREPVAAGTLAGIHLEGPFLSEARRGAHDPAVLRDPDLSAIDRLVDTGRGAVRMVTLAPERPGSRAAIERLTERGVLAAVGHTDATSDEVGEAVEAGATVATHLFNGMRGLHHREPGPVGTLLDDERVTIELICDLVHLHPTAVRLVAQHAPQRTVLITDAISATGAGDGVYALGELRVTVRDGEPRLDDGSLAGSTLTMDTAFRNLVLRCGLPIELAVAAAATTPASLLGLADRLGSLRPGLAADLVVLDAELRPLRVLRNGMWHD